MWNFSINGVTQYTADAEMPNDIYKSAKYLVQWKFTWMVKVNYEN